MGVRAGEQRRPGPDVRVIDREMAVGDDLAGKHREGKALGHVVPSEERIAGQAGR